MYFIAAIFMVYVHCYSITRIATRDWHQTLYQISFPLDRWLVLHNDGLKRKGYDTTNCWDCIRLLSRHAIFLIKTLVRFHQVILNYPDNGTNCFSLIYIIWVIFVIPPVHDYVFYAAMEGLLILNHEIEASCIKFNCHCIIS